MANEWKYDADRGRYYRDFGNGCREWMPDYFFTGSANNTPRLQKEVSRTCPIKTGMSNKCDGDECSFFSAGLCSLAKVEHKPPRDTDELRCPLRSGRCRKDCALYLNGCLLVARLLNNGGKKRD